MSDDEGIDEMENRLSRSDQPRGFPTVAQVVGVWQEKFENHELDDTHFKEHWRLYVPRVLSLNPSTNCLENGFDEADVQKILFAPLEEFICGGNPDEVFERITRLDDPPSVCGRVFKLGEPTYNCRECGTDPTCVLCVDCFKKSEHRNHRYKMSTSSGGGCCDCGDVEAWKKHPYCSIHVIATQEDASKSTQFPEDMRERTRLTFRAVLQYCYQLLSIDHEPKLPIELRLKESEDDSFNLLTPDDVYCTVLYNDETHTFDHVINALTKVIKCTYADAVEYVNNIDREGRAVVKCSSFHHCSDLKDEVEKFTGRSGAHPLKVQVKHSHVVAHQMYALKLLSWFQKILSYSKSFREVFAEVVLETKKKPAMDISILEGILLRDSVLWKSARVHWHRLFICGMLKEYENKKKFAIIFTKHYGTIMKDFIRDDHDHSFSVATLAVQIYTVRTIAHHLIAEHDVLFVLLNTFWSECGTFIKDNKLEFQRSEHSAGTTTFKRAQYIIFDLHYLLSCVPEVWTVELRKGFVEGLLLFLKLLSAMQGMDSVTRQVGQHMEYEPEWETAFNLHIRLSSIITSMIKWCGSDRTALIKSYRATLRKLFENPCLGLTEPGVIREIADHSTTCINYDVSEKAVSIHLPLSRFLAGLYVQLEKFGLQFYSTEFNSMSKQTPEQIIEPVLRTQVMIAQVHAGLWRRNGYSILHQIYFYHNVKCRNEMLNKDIILLQFGASLIESNDFLIHLMHKFKLMEWADPEFENAVKREDDGLRQTTQLVEEFLALLITIVSERYVVGVGKVTEKDCIKKEIIQQLCIKPMSHSELSKTLPDNEDHSTSIDDIIAEVATFEKPVSGTGKGMYKLKPEYYDQYNVFFYHYTKEELSKSEEAQRKRRKQESSLDCCPPPPLPPLTDVFAPMLVNLLQCDVVFYVIQLVLKRACDMEARSFSESQLHRVLYLIGFALHEEQSRLYDHFMFTERCEKWDIVRYLKELNKSPRVEAYRDLIKWTMAKYQQVSVETQALNAKKNSLTPPAEVEEKMEVEESASASTTAPADEDTNEDRVKKEKERIAKLAAERRLKIMAQMCSAQKSFIKENAKLYEEATSFKGDDSMSWRTTESVEFPIAVGREQTHHVDNDPTYTCILCQEDQVIRSDARAMVYGAYIQKSTVLKNEFHSPVQSMKPKELYFLQSSLSPSIYASICGHVMHYACYEKYFLNLSTKENRRTYRLRQPISFDIDKSEFLCPLCESLNNAILPILPPLNNVVGAAKPAIAEQVTFDAWLISILKATERKPEPPSSKPHVEAPEEVENDDHESMDTIESYVTTDEEPAAVASESATVSDMVWDDQSGGGSSSKEASSVETTRHDEIEILLLTNPTDIDDLEAAEEAVHRPYLSESLRSTIAKFVKSVCAKGLDEADVDENRSSMYCWKACAYTIHVVEILLRNENRSLLGDLPTRQKKCIKALIRLSTMHEIYRDGGYVTSYALVLLRIILDCNHQFKKGSVLDWDTFGMMVTLIMSLPSLFFLRSPGPFPSGSTLDYYIARLMLMATVTQVLIAVDMERESQYAEEEEELEEESGGEDDTECLKWYLRFLERSEAVNTRRLWRHVTNSSLSFLRCACIFFRYLTGIRPPDCLKQMSGDTYKNMCQYLGLPQTCKELMGDEMTKKMFEKWTRKWQKCQQLQRSPLKFLTYFNHRGLITLPKDYSELINSVSTFTCPNSDHEDSRNPTLCLVCGTMLCSQTYCCRREVNGTPLGACSQHAYLCGAGAGIFLRIRECEVLLLSCPSRGCMMPAPYLDNYGETDQGLRRGNPLKLCPAKYKKLENLWLAHAIHEEVSRSLESSHTLTMTQWHQL